MAAYLDSTYADKLRFRGSQRHSLGNMSESHAPLGSFRLPDILRALKEEEMAAESDELFQMIEKRSKHFDGCSVEETAGSYGLKPWSGFGFQAHIVPLRIKVETINTKLKAVRADKTGARIELELVQTVPEITRGIVMVRGLAPGSYTGSNGQGSQQPYQVAEDGVLKIEAVSAQGRLVIAGRADGSR